MKKLILIILLASLSLTVLGCDNPSYTADEVLGIAQANYASVENNPQGLFTGQPYNWWAEYQGKHQWLIQAVAQKDPTYDPGIAKHLANSSTEVTLSWKFYERTDTLVYEFAYFKTSN